MIGNFTFNGITSQSLGLVAKSISRPILPPIRPRTVEINGVSGIYDYGRVAHTTRMITMQIGWITKTDYYAYRAKTHDIAAWLDTETWSDLIINDEPDKCYKARVVGGVNLEQLYKLGRAEVTFECQPYAYALLGTGDDTAWGDAETTWGSIMTWDTLLSYSSEVFSVASGSFTFNNPGNQAINFRSPQGSKFTITIYGIFWPITITLNGKSLTLDYYNTGYVVIDCINMTVTADGVTNKLANVTGDYATFFECLPGDNTLTFTGEYITCSFLIDIIPMWI